MKSRQTLLIWLKPAPDQALLAFHLGFLCNYRVDQEHTALAAEIIARNATTPREQELVRAAAANMVRFKLAKFEGIYDAYA